MGELLVERTDQSHGSVCYQNSIVGCVWVQMCEFVVESKRCYCSVRSQNSIVGDVGVQVCDFWVVENTPRSMQCVFPSNIGGRAGVQTGELLVVKI